MAGARTIARPWSSGTTFFAAPRRAGLREGFPRPRDEVRGSFYAIPVERRLRHPGVVALAEAARDERSGRGRA
jgi:hypothetical protein